jgi:HTH-type transcriptional regulator / antitoxin HigA
VARTKAGGAFEYEPDYAVPPGRVLAEMLDALQMSHAEFARRCGRSAKLISEIIAGKAPIEPGTALQFERVLGMAASVWLNLEARYQLHNAKMEEEAAIREAAEWANPFSTADLVKLGLLEKPSDLVDKARKLLAFFGVGSIGAWKEQYAQFQVQYRHSPSFESSREALITWLRIGEIWGDQQECGEYNRSAFLRALREIMDLTHQRPEQFMPRVRELCNESGVAFVIVPAIGKSHVSGAARWLNPRKALIQQSGRHRTNDHIWFTFFHEAAHILFHSKREIFIDETDGVRPQDVEEEAEADNWAGERLAPNEAIRRFRGVQRISRISVERCATEFNIEPGLLVGRLQYEKILDWKNLNGLKQYFDLVPTGGGPYTLMSRSR